jgi:capsule biosynthesis phosphatase
MKSKLKNKIICFDLDNVICKTDKKKNYKNSKPIKLAIKKVNQLKKNNKIIIFTARGMGRFNGDLKKVNLNFYKLTLNQLKRWGVEFDKLIMGKPSYDLIIDDKSYRYDQKWKKKVN